MDRQSVEHQVMELLAATTLREASSITHQCHLEADLGLDSIAMASLIAKFEHLIADETRMATCLHSLLTSETVGELIELIHKNCHVKS